MDKLLTISIAAYNMESYIRQALDSMIVERLIDDLEVFVIDDGGTDRTLEITQEYAQRYPHSIFPVHKENGGYGTTVNYSIEHATGKYFKLLDGDDEFDRKAFSCFVALLKAVDADIIISSVTIMKGRRAKTKREENVKMGKVIELCELDRIQNCSIWTTTVRTEILQQAGILLPEKCLYTDTIYMIKVLAQARTIYFCDLSVYRYRLDRSGQSSSPDVIAKHYQEQIRVFKLMAETYVACKSQGNPNLPVLRYRLMYTYQKAVSAIMRLNPKVALEVLRRFETDGRQTINEVYTAAEKRGKLGAMLWLLRRTNYMFFPLAKISFDIWHNKGFGGGGLTGKLHNTPVIADCMGCAA